MGQTAFQTLFDRFLTPLDDPGSRLFHLHILSSIVLIAIFFFFAQKEGALLSFRQRFKRAILRRRYWWNRSTRADYVIYALNSVFKVLLFIPLLDFGFRFSQWTVRGLLALNGGEFAGLAAKGPALVLFTLAIFVWDDFLRFFHHWLMHKVPWLWPFHATHHSARILTPITLYRTHPVEAAMATVRNSFSLGVATGVFLFLFEGRFNVVTFLGVNLFGQVFNFLGSNLRHSHIRLSFGPLERIFISPLQHQVHHSRALEDRDKNFGVSLAVWDSLFGSLVLSRQVEERKLHFGVEGAFQSSVVTIVMQPILTTFSSGFHVLSKRAARLRAVVSPAKSESPAKDFASSDEASKGEIEMRKLARSVLGLFAAMMVAAPAMADLTVYSDRAQNYIQPAIDAFTKATGQKVVVINEDYGKLLARLKADGAASTADVVYVKDLVYLAELAKGDYFQPMASSLIKTSVAPQMRDPNSLWTAITVRGRTIMYMPGVVDPKDLKGYEDLANPKWAGKLCLRTSASAYNEALVGGLIETHGRNKAKAIVAGWVKNLATEVPHKSDGLILQAIANGECEVGITNTYYLAQAIAKDPTFPVKPFFADQATSGVYSNGTGAGIAKHSKQATLANQFIELLLSDDQQTHMVKLHLDFPAKLGLQTLPLFQEWGTPQYNSANWVTIGSRAQEARDLMKEVDYK